MNGVPDFATIYSWEGCPLTPRMAFYLWSIAQFLHDQWSDNVKDDPAFVLQELPPIVRRVADEVWLERFVQCFKGHREPFGNWRVHLPRPGRVHGRRDGGPFDRGRCAGGTR